MITNESLNRFRGKAGYKKVNCAQAIAAASLDHYELNEEIVDEFKKYGGGKAPGKHCGAYYAARYIIEKNNPEILNELDEYFISHAGSTLCREIRKSKSLSCSDCVEKAANFLVDKIDK